MAAAMQRTRSRLVSSAPPPSPIATAKGLRSAAIDDRVLSEFLNKTLEIPELTLPDPYLRVRVPRGIPAEIDLSSLLARDGDAVRRLFESAADLGAFQLTGHGMSPEQIAPAMADWNEIFGAPAVAKKQLSRFFRRANAVREDLYWRRAEKESMRVAFEEIGVESYSSFCEKMETIYMKMEGIAQNVREILFEYNRKSDEKQISQMESVLCLHRYNHDNLLEGSSSNYNMQMERDNQSIAHALRLHQHQCSGDILFFIRSQKGVVPFNVTAGAIVVTVGPQQLQEWSQGALKYVMGEPTFEPVVDADPSFTLEFMCSPSSLNFKAQDPVPKTITLLDQMLIALFIFCLFNLLTSLSS